MISQKKKKMPGADEESHALLFEMIRSFTTLARTLNLSHAVKELGSTRQTVRRHIAQLEAAKGVKLFTLTDRQYRLTEEGRRSLPEALGLLARGRSWLLGHVSHNNGMQCLHAALPEGRSFWLQQQSMADIWQSDRSLLRDCYRAWAMAGGELEHAAMRHVRPYFMVYRKSANGWICVEIGDESSYVSWFGWANARSSIGRNLDGLPGGDEIAHLMIEPFEDTSIHQNTRLDHIHLQLPREKNGPYIPLCYRRLLMCGRFPDGTLALISILDRCYDVHIDGLSRAAILSMPEELTMPAHPLRVLYERDARE
ncbi:MAG: LysR family transcriptional regulator [Pseudomonadota bacterium]